ncbi:predicted protein [Histoplasma mississippiense (nom. inval.)]|uniref:predicted protein n=1 Tax=Ajellomyces capsulatus (strain NAm1 / WU24) TaxID=2059318 RepID=UPI000157CE7F|nr:predicted protein [Histoplasma mississippiense (nom. inval.)]EDN10211.1 predicted protein [Histoplasma mississippiense (nom. inval.)]
MSVARSLPSSPSSSAPRLASQFLRTRTSTAAPSRLLTTGPSRRQAALLPSPLPLSLRRGVAATAGWFQVANGVSWTQRGKRDTATRRFSTAAAAAAAADKIAERNPEFKRYGFEEITASLPTTSTTPAPILIDVREPAELRATGIIPTAQNIPIGTHPDALFLPPDEFLTRFGFAEARGRGIVIVVVRRRHRLREKEINRTSSSTARRACARAPWAALAVPAGKQKKKKKKKKKNEKVVDYSLWKLLT